METPSLITMPIGDLLSMLLIQVQKSKVDLEAAMMAMDRLLKANELNFELLAVIPLLALLYVTVGTGRSYLRKWLNRSENHYQNSLREKIHDLQVILNSPKDESEVLGDSLITIQSILDDWARLSSRVRSIFDDRFLRDLSELLSTFTIERKTKTIARMFHFYPFLQAQR